MADFGQTDFGQLFCRPSLAKPTLARVSVLVVWPTLAKTDFGQTFGQFDFDLLCVWCVVCGVVWCVVCCVLCCVLCVVCCVLCVVWGCVLCGVVWCCIVVVRCVCAVWRGYLFHGFMERGFMCGCWFQVWLDRPSRDRPSRDRPSLGPPKISLFFHSPAAKFVLFFPLWGLLVEFWWCF